MVCHQRDDTRSASIVFGASTLLACLLLAGCHKSATSPSGNGLSGSSGGSPATSATTADLIFCVTETNRYRAMQQRPALTRSSALETFAAEGARADGHGTVPHQHFEAQRPPLVALAENELHRLPFNLFGSIQQAMREAMQAYYAEGPSGGHYQNLMGPFADVGCGVYLANGEITLVQNFR